jgi:hypothetical protein
VIPRLCLAAALLLLHDVPAALLAGVSRPLPSTDGEAHATAAGPESGLLATGDRSARARTLPDFVKSSEYPFDSSAGHTHKMQGVAHDASHWYMTNRWNLFKVPAGLDLGVPGSWAARARIPGPLRGYDHLGDLDYHDGRLYVPVEGLAPAIAVFDTDLNYLSHALLPEAADAPWCAISPLDGHLYASSFRTSEVGKYRMAWIGSRLVLTRVGSVPLRDDAGRPLRLRRVQGGAFSATGKLYLVSDVTGEGIKVFDLESGRLQAAIRVDFAHDEELEGIDIWDVDGAQVPGIDGQVHLQMIDHDWWSGDDFFFKHYRVAEPAMKAHM